MKLATFIRTAGELRRDVMDALGRLGEESVARVDVQVDGGTVTLRGRADRKTTAQLALEIAAEVPGVTDVVNRLSFDLDDTKAIPRYKDPWAIGPLMKSSDRYSLN